MAASYNNVASNLVAQGCYEEAEPLYNKAVCLIEKLPGDEPTNSTAMRENLEFILRKISNRE